MLQDEQNIPARLVYGGIKYKEVLIFDGEVPSTFLQNQNVKGHFWVQIDDDFIIDGSIFRTLYSDRVQSVVRDRIIEEFGINRGSLMGFKSDIHNSYNFEYISKCDDVGNDVVEAFIRGWRANQKNK